jgi:protein-disulfide isomerase
MNGANQMHLYRWAGFVLILLPVCGGFRSIRAADSETDVVAEVGGHKITRAELEQKESARLLKIRSQYYQAERDALNQLIDDYLLEQKAAAEHLTVPELIKRDIESHIQDPTEDQLRVYYEGVGTDEPYPAVRDKILGYIRQNRIRKARAEYVRALEEKAGVTVSMAAPTQDVPVDGAPLRGPREAKVRIIEFADYECPYCRQVHPLLQKLEKEFDGKIALVFKDMPLPIHPAAEKAAEAAHCAGAQGRFWELHDMIFDNPKQAEVGQLKEYARALHLDTERFDKCLDSGEQSTAVQKEFEEAKTLGLTGTPSFFINGHFFSGAVKYAALRDMVEQELNTKDRK